MSKPIDDVKKSLENVVLNVEIISNQIKDLRLLTIDIIDKIEEHQQRIKEIEQTNKEKIKSTSWFF